MDVVTAYLYGSIDANVYMKILEEFTLLEAMNSKPQSMYSIKLQRDWDGSGWVDTGPGLNRAELNLTQFFWAKKTIAQPSPKSGRQGQI